MKYDNDTYFILAIRLDHGMCVGSSISVSLTTPLVLPLYFFQ